MSVAFTYERRVEFRDTDAAGIMHFSTYFAYMEEAEHAWLRHLGTSVMQQVDDCVIGWPRVSATCDYQGSVKFEQRLQIEVTVERVGEKSVTYGFRFVDDEREVAHGKMTSVCCRIVHDQPPTSIPIPADLKAQLVAHTKADE